MTWPDDFAGRSGSLILDNFLTVSADLTISLMKEIYLAVRKVSRIFKHKQERGARLSQYGLAASGRHRMKSVPDQVQSR